MSKSLNIHQTRCRNFLHLSLKICIVTPDTFFLDGHSHKHNIYFYSIIFQGLNIFSIRYIFQSNNFTGDHPSVARRSLAPAPTSGECRAPETG